MRVRIKSHWPPGHIRTPAYLRGKTGVIQRCIGPFNNPEQSAYRLPCDRHDLLRVKFTMGEIWGSRAENPTDILEAEVYSHWIEPADAT